MGQTVVQKILSRKLGRAVTCGEYIFVKVDGAMASDTTAPQMIQAFQAMGGKRIWDPQKLALVLDHASPAPNEKVARLHQLIRAFAKEQNCRLYETGAGICHHLMLDNGHVAADEVFIGADSHTCTYGAIGAFATGVGSTDLAAVLLTGKIWLRVPASIRLSLSGNPQLGVSSKDIMLSIVGQLGPDLCNYRSLEFAGDFFDRSSLAARIPFANMGAELGAKSSLIENPASSCGLADADADYIYKLDVDVNHIKPQICVPHGPHNNRDVDDCVGIRIELAFLGACTNTRIEDLREAATVLRGQQVAEGVRLYIVPATRNTLLEAIRDGTMETLTAAGATFLPSGCGPCVGTHLGVPGDDENVISAANRNYRGRMGNPKANIYLASPATVAASAIRGKICNPQDYLR